MTTIVITAAEHEVLERDHSVWLVRGGERWGKVANHLTYVPGSDPALWAMSAEFATYPPVELVTAAAPCKTCGGSHERHYEWGGRAGTADPCPDCRIALVGECPTCRGAKCAYPCATRPEPLECVEYECYCTCQGSGTVTLGYAYADSEVLPIISQEKWDQPNPPVPCIVVYYDSGWRLTLVPLVGAYCDLTTAIAHYGDLPALVGQFALQLRLA